MHVWTSCTSVALLGHGSYIAGSLALRRISDHSFQWRGPLYHELNFYRLTLTIRLEDQLRGKTYTKYCKAPAESTVSGCCMPVCKCSYCMYLLRCFKATIHDRTHEAPTAFSTASDSLHPLTVMMLLIHVFWLVQPAPLRAVSSMIF